MKKQPAARKVTKSRKNRKSSKDKKVLVQKAHEPIRLKNVVIDGVSAHACAAGETAKIWTRLSLLSDEAFFHEVAESIGELILGVTRNVGTPVRIMTKNNILMIIHADKTADLWVDTAATVLQILSKRPIESGTIIFEDDIADVGSMSFPNIKILPTDKVICLFREGWRFGLFFDFNSDRKFSLTDMERDLGTLYRRMKYKYLYDMLADKNSFQRIVNVGWFPFIEILGPDFKKLVNAGNASTALKEFEQQLILKFNEERVERMFSRWKTKPHFTEKEKILRVAVNAFKDNEPITVLKVILTEIEGILANAYKARFKRTAKIDTLLSFAIETAEQKNGNIGTLWFPESFAQYLKEYTFSNFNPMQNTSHAGSRHAVGHGAAKSESYTQTRALQALLTLDQLSFYIS